jgi:hypothetical protein
MVQLNAARSARVRFIDLPSAVEGLGFAPAGVRIRMLSVYLDASPRRIAGKAYLLSVRDGCRALRAGIAAED